MILIRVWLKCWIRKPPMYHTINHTILLQMSHAKFGDDDNMSWILDRTCDIGQVNKMRSAPNAASN